MGLVASTLRVLLYPLIGYKTEENPADTDTPPDRPGGPGAAEGPLHEAARENDAESLRELLLLGAWGDSANVTNGRQQTPLHVAAAENSLDCVQLLLDYGADSTMRDAAGMVALHYAARDGHRDVIAAILRAHGLSSVDARDAWGWTPLQRSLTNCHYRTAAALLESGCAVNEADEKQRTALHVAASYGHVRMASLLVAKGAAVDPRDRNGWTPLMLAVVGGHLQVVRDLIHCGSDVNLRNAQGLSALLLCCRGLSVDKQACAVELVVAGGAECSEITAVLEDFFSRISPELANNNGGGGGGGGRARRNSNNAANNPSATAAAAALSLPLERSKQLIRLLVRAAGSLPASIASRAVWWYENRPSLDEGVARILRLIAVSGTVSMLRSATRTFLLESRAAAAAANNANNNGGGDDGDGNGDDRREEARAMRLPVACPSLKDLCRCVSRQHLSAVHGNVLCAVKKITWLPHGLREMLILNDI